jgi:glycosyltransferase involved in cell wall biosynthesis
MLITYLVTVYNKEKYIGHVIDSLKSIKGNFRKEFIIINDGSTDDSLSVIKKHSASLPKVTIINQKNFGPALSINEGIGLASGDYIHFVDGDDVVAQDATERLLAVLKDSDEDVAYGLSGKYDYETGELIPSKRESGDMFTKQVITNPIKAILEGKIPRIRSIGGSGTLVSRELLESVGGADPEVFVQDVSISLRCAEYSNFVYLPKTVCYKPANYDENHLSSSKKFEIYNKLKATLRFMEDNQDLAVSFVPELNRSLWSSVYKLNKYNIATLLRYCAAKYTTTHCSIEDLQRLYRGQIDKLA